MWMFSTGVTSPRVLSYRCVLHYFLTMPVGFNLNLTFGLKPQVKGIKIVTIYKRTIFQVEWLIATLICSWRCSNMKWLAPRETVNIVSLDLTVEHWGSRDNETHCWPYACVQSLRWLKTVYFPRRRFWWVIITTLYQLMLQPWYQNTAQSLVNTLILFSWRYRLP